jgi:hypothetical protein
MFSVLLGHLCAGGVSVYMMGVHKVHVVRYTHLLVHVCQCRCRQMSPAFHRHEFKALCTGIVGRYNSVWMLYQQHSHF